MTDALTPARYTRLGRRLGRQALTAPAVRYVPPEGFSFDILTRLGEAFRYEDLEIEIKTYGEVPVRVISPRTLWLMKRDTVRPVDQIDAAALAERFGFEES